MFTDGYQVIGDDSMDYASTVFDRPFDGGDDEKNSVKSKLYKMLFGIVSLVLIFAGAQYWMTSTMVDHHMAGLRQEIQWENQVFTEERLQAFRQEVSSEFQVMIESNDEFKLKAKQADGFYGAQSANQALCSKDGNPKTDCGRFQQQTETATCSQKHQSGQDNLGGIKASFTWVLRILHSALDWTLDQVFRVLQWFGSSADVSSSEDAIPGIFAIGLGVLIAYVLVDGMTSRRSSSESQTGSPPESPGRRHSRSSDASRKGRRTRSNSRDNDTSGYATSDDEWELPGRSLFPAPTPPPKSRSMLSQQQLTSPVWETRNRVARGLDTPGRSQLPRTVLRLNIPQSGLKKRERLAQARLNARRAYEAGELGK